MALSCHHYMGASNIKMWRDMISSLYYFLRIIYFEQITLPCLKLKKCKYYKNVVKSQVISHGYFWYLVGKISTWLVVFPVSLAMGSGKLWSFWEFSSGHWFIWKSLCKTWLIWLDSTSLVFFLLSPFTHSGWWDEPSLNRFACFLSYDVVITSFISATLRASLTRKATLCDS